MMDGLSLPEYECLAAAICRQTLLRSELEVARDAANLAMTSKSLRCISDVIFCRLDGRSPACALATPYRCPLSADRRKSILSNSRWVHPAKVREAFLLETDGLVEGDNRMIRRDAVIGACLAKYGDEEGHAAELRRRMKLEECPDKQRRFHSLQTELSRVNCEFRADSELCRAYVAVGRGDPRRIAATMAEMRFMHECTRYASIFKKLRITTSGTWVQASLEARREALSRWVRTHGGPRLASQRHELPDHLRLEISACTQK